MSTDTDTQIRSLRVALKVCSFAIMMVSLADLTHFLMHIEMERYLYSDMIPKTDMPVIFLFTSFLSYYFLLVAAFLLTVVIVALIMTIRSRGGIFLYINIGLAIFVSIIKWFLLVGLQTSFWETLEALTR